jgi:diaminohydroxyphosphoribosylaminopyrimidine deaminase/5-amino-6-(5-phosphoribosylamino)uracil reductase
MVGTNTVIADNPRLNTRRWTGANPVRITLDRRGRLSENAHILDGTQDTIVFSGVKGNYSGKIRIVHADPSYELVDVMEELYDQQITSILVEGGAQLHTSFLASGLWDEARVFTGKMSFSQGVKSPEINEKPDEMIEIGDTELTVFINKETTLHGS